MNKTGVINTMVDKDSPTQDRIEAIKQLGMIRLRERERLGERVDDLSDSELSGQKALRRVIQRTRELLEVRCHAAAIAAKTDSRHTLEWCNEMIQRHC